MWKQRCGKLCSAHMYSLYSFKKKRHHTCFFLTVYTWKKTFFCKKNLFSARFSWQCMRGCTRAYTYMVPNNPASTARHGSTAGPGGLHGVMDISGVSMAGDPKISCQKIWHQKNRVLHETFETLKEVFITLAFTHSLASLPSSLQKCSQTGTSLLSKKKNRTD